MRNTQIKSISLNKETIKEIKDITNNKKYKFQSESHTYDYILQIGIKNFKDGQRLVSFVDNILGE